MLERISAMRAVPQLGTGAALTLILSLGYLFAPRPVAMSLREVVTPSIHCDLTSTDPWDPHALAMLRSVDGPIVTDAAELKLVDQRANLQWIDLMVLTSMQELGTFDDKLLLDAIRQHQIAALALDPEGLARSFRGRPLFWPRLRRAIEANYQTVPAIGPPYVMLPIKAR